MRERRYTKRKRPRDYTSFEGWLDQLLNDIFEASDDVCGYSTPQLAEEAKLSVSCVWRIREGYTKEPQMSTIWKLVGAVGMDRAIVKEELAVVRERKAG